MERGKNKKNDILRDPGSSKSSSGLDGSSNSTKSHDSEKNAKVTKSASKTDHRGGGKSTWRPYLPPGWLFGGASWHKCVILWIRGAKKQHSGPPKTPKNGPGTKNTKKILPGGSPKESQRSIRACKITRGNKITTERHNRAVVSPKT